MFQGFADGLASMTFPDPRSAVRGHRNDALPVGAESSIREDSPVASWEKDTERESGLGPSLPQIK